MIVIGLCGRKSSGKSELSNVCKEYGFVILHFADALKNLVCTLLNCDRNKLEQIKNTSQLFTFCNDDIKYLSDILEIDYNIIYKKINNKQFTTREILQFLGTDIIREFNPDWHIAQIRNQMYDKTLNYCFDDCRFNNEKEFIENELKGTCYFIIRPSIFDISNHKSETTLKWIDFDEVILNDLKLELFTKKWRKYLHTLINPEFKNNSVIKRTFENKLKFRIWLKEQLLTKSTIEIAKILNCSRDKIVWWSNLLMINISRYKYTYNRNAFLYPHDLDSYCAGLLTADGCIKSIGKHKSLISLDVIDNYLVSCLQKLYETNRPISEKKISITRYNSSKKIDSIKQCYSIDCPDSYIIENLKYWNIKPRKSQIEEVPDIIKNNESAIKNWIVGLIDGDGTISITKKTKSLIIRILSSKEIIEFINTYCPINHIMKQHKKTKLYQLDFINFYAIDLYEWLNPKYCLPRKWDKINEFLEFNTTRRTQKYIK